MATQALDVDTMQQRLDEVTLESPNPAAGSPANSNERDAGEAKEQVPLEKGGMPVSEMKKLELAGKLPVEPMLRDNPDRFVLFPIQHQDIWDAYKRAEASFWTAEEIDLGQDQRDFDSMTSGEQHFVKHVLAFFLPPLTVLCSRTLWRTFALRSASLRLAAFTASRWLLRTSTPRYTPSSSTLTLRMPVRRLASSTPLRPFPASARRLSGQCVTWTRAFAPLPSASWVLPPLRVSSSPVPSAPSSGLRSVVLCPALPSPTSSSAVTRVCTPSLPACSSASSTTRLPRRVWPRSSALPSKLNASLSPLPSLLSSLA
mmetsp:Transcript_5185/g.8970  ORF Transcript_5185/g.8970 Transcript_5185/m.8970 type:complete len:315 (-) Transcript_5185:885-1829(-)